MLRNKIPWLVLAGLFLSGAPAAQATPAEGEEEYMSYTSTYRGVGAVDWHPNGDWILFVRDGQNIDREQYIYKIRADGTSLTQLTTYGDDGDPTWSPDGSSIAFISSRSGGDFFKMNPSGANITSLGFHEDCLWLAAWSPDGQQIAFVTRRNNYGPLLALMDAQGNEQRFLPLAAGDDADDEDIAGVERALPPDEPAPKFPDNADWHPSGRYMVVEAEGPDGNDHLYEVEAHHLRRLR